MPDDLKVQRGRLVAGDLYVEIGPIEERILRLLVVRAPKEASRDDLIDVIYSHDPDAWTGDAAPVVLLRMKVLGDKLKSVGWNLVSRFGETYALRRD